MISGFLILTSVSIFGSSILSTGGLNSISGVSSFTIGGVFKFIFGISISISFSFSLIPCPCRSGKLISKDGPLISISFVSMLKLLSSSSIISFCISGFFNSRSCSVDGKCGGRSSILSFMFVPLRFGLVISNDGVGTVILGSFVPITAPLRMFVGFLSSRSLLLGSSWGGFISILSLMFVPLRLGPTMLISGLISSNSSFGFSIEGVLISISSLIIGSISFGVVMISSCGFMPSIIPDIICGFGFSNSNIGSVV